MKPVPNKCPTCTLPWVQKTEPHPQKDWDDYAVMVCYNGHSHSYKVKVTSVIRKSDGKDFTKRNTKPAGDSTT